MHRDQLDAASEVVRSLVDHQFPQWASLPLRAIEPAGTENALFRLGDALAVRLLLRGQDAEDVRRKLRAEADAARELNGRTRFATPAPVALGDPGPGYPLPWAIQTWVEGTPATPAEPASTAFAHDIAELVRGIRTIDTRGRTFSGTRRGGHLPDHDAWLETCFEKSEGLLDVDALRTRWATLRELPRRSADVMCHRDLIPGNLLVRDGRLTGVIDVGGLGPADPALDLVAAWHLFDAGPRRALREALGSDDVEWARGQAWAFQQAMGLVWYYRETNPPMAELGRSTLARILAEPL